MRNIGVVTVARSDYGIYLPILKKLKADPNLHLYLIVSGMHLSPEFGRTIEVIKTDGFEIGDQFELLLSSDTPEGIAKSTGLGSIGFAQSYARYTPDMLLVLGDRFEMLSAVVAALPFAIPVAHIHGGEATEGLIDDPIRHAITKMSHLHFATTTTYCNRIIQMGEAPWRVILSGAPSLDNLAQIEYLPDQELEKRIGLPLSPAPILVTFHPVTLEFENTTQHIEHLMGALHTSGHPVVFTYPNSDTHGRQIIQAIDQYVNTHANAKAVTNLGTQAYFSLMKKAATMVGNSSSGIIEAASFKLPVVNIGNRQRGRIHDRNVIDVACETAAITQAIQKATSPEFHQSLHDLKNPYGNGDAAEKIVDTLKNTAIDNRLLAKSFYDMENP